MTKADGSTDGARLDALHRIIGWGSIQAWNDAPGRTWPEVREALLRAADTSEGTTP
jgi:hypothetical protein